MSANNSKNSEEAETYAMISKMNTHFADLGEETQRLVTTQKIQGSKTTQEWLQMVQQVLAFKHQARGISSKKNLRKPPSSQALIREFFYWSAFLFALLFFIVEHFIHSLSWEMWKYVGAIIGLSLVVTLIRTLISKNRLRQAKEAFARYQRYHQDFVTIRQAESRILPTYNNFLHPLLAFIKEEMHSKETLELYFDLGHWKLPEYKVEGRDLLANSSVLGTDFYEMKVLETHSKLANGTLLNLGIQKAVRERHIRKVNQRGKIKYKTKTRYKLLYEVRLNFPVKAFKIQNTPPSSASNMKVKVNSNEKRHSIKIQQIVVAANYDKSIQYKVFIDLLALAHQHIVPFSKK